MPVDLDKIRALLASVAGFTEGPWVAYRYARNDAAVAVAETDKDKHEHPGALIVGQTDARDAALIAAAPDLHRELTEAVGEIERLRAHEECNTIARANLVDEAKRLRERLDGVAKHSGRMPTRTVRVVTADRDALAAEVDARIADAVAADRAAVGAWIRACVPEGGGYARCIEHGDHIDDDAPPLPSLRMAMLARDELLRQVETLTAERDRRIDPVEHALAVREAYREGHSQAPSDGRAWQDKGPKVAWIEQAYSRDDLLARVGADVLAEVER